MIRHGWKLLLLVVLGVIVFLWLIKTPFVSAYFSRKMGVHVSLENASIGPHKTNLSWLKIANPKGFGNKAAFKAEETLITYRTNKLLTNPVEIDLIELDNVYVNVQLPSSDPGYNNWTALGQDMPPSRKGRAVVIHKLVLNRLTIELEGKFVDQYGIGGPRYFDKMEFDEINSDQGFPTRELAGKIFETGGVGQYMQIFLKSVKDQLPKTLNPLKVFGTEKPLETPQGVIEMD